MNTLLLKLNARFVSLIGHSAAAGARPTLFAATSPEAKPLGYYGPNGIFELKGPVAPAVVSPKANDHAVAGKLWQVSEELTGVRWPKLPPLGSLGTDDQKLPSVFEQHKSLAAIF
jgi:hypothetical protein